MEITREKVDALKTAGFSPEEILDLFVPHVVSGPSSPAPEKTPEEAPAAPGAVDTPDSDPAPAVKEEPTHSDQLLATIEKLIGTIQASNIIHSGRDDTKTLSQKVDDTLTEILSLYPEVAFAPLSLSLISAHKAFTSE